MYGKIDDIPIKTTFEQVLKELKLDTLDTDDISMVNELFIAAKEIVKPKVLYKEAYVEEISERNIRINGITFESDVVAANLKNVHRVFAYVCTCGKEVDDWSRKENDYFVTLWLDMIKEMFLHEATMYFIEQIKNIFNFKKLFTINPGSGNIDNWPISQQVQLFDLIGNVEDEIGVKLTDSFLMIPIKSTSGLLYPSDTEFVNCSLCGRDNCPRRRAALDTVLYKQIFKKDI